MSDYPIEAGPRPVTFEVLNTLAVIPNGKRVLEVRHTQHLRSRAQFCEIVEICEDGREYRVRIPSNFVARVADALADFGR